VVAPFDYTAMIWAFLLGYFFDELPTIFVYHWRRHRRRGRTVRGARSACSAYARPKGRRPARDWRKAYRSENWRGDEPRDKLVAPGCHGESPQPHAERRARHPQPYCYRACPVCRHDRGISQSYPARPITLIVPYAAGGSVDAVARIVVPKVSERLGPSVVIENVAGAGGIVGTQRAARAAPDGYTLLFSVESTMAIAKLVQPSTVQYDSQKDFQPISLIGTSPLVLAGKKDLAANTTDELIKLARANPGKLSYATSGTGTSLHVAGEMINMEGKVAIVHVPYRWGADGDRSHRNQIDLAMLPLVMALPNYRNGNIKVFGTTEPTRLACRTGPAEPRRAPRPRNVNVTVWFGLFAPPRPTRDRRAPAPGGRGRAAGCRRARQARRDRPSHRRQHPAEFTAFLAQEIEKFSAIVKAANIKAE
jgi:tripartite-type tricarboxylate transporter receptor subunit TctC